MDPDTAELLTKLRDLHKQATTERSHYYTANLVEQSIEAIERYSRNLNNRDEFIGAKGLWDEFVSSLPR